MVWLPTDGNETPNFLIPKRDTGELTIHTGFNAALDGVFNDIVVVECEGDMGLMMGDLYTAIFEIVRETLGLTSIPCPNTVVRQW
jgi:hypothetical protein